MKSILLKNLGYLIRSFLLFCVFFSGTAAAQSQSATADVERVMQRLEQRRLFMQRELEQKVRLELENYLDNGQYIITVDLPFDRQKISQAWGSREPVSLQTIGTTVGLEEQREAFVQKYANETVLELCRLPSVRLYLDKKIAGETARILVNRVASLMGLQENQRERVQTVFQDLSRFQQVRPTEQLRLMNLKVESERLDAEAKARAILAENEKLQRQVNMLEGQLTALNQEDRSTFGFAKKMLRGWEMPAALVIIFVLASIPFSIFFLLFIRAQNTQSSRLLEGMNSVSEALVKANSGARSVSRIRESSAAAQAATTSAFVPLEANDTAKAEAEATWEVLQGRMYPTLAVLKDWLQEPEGRRRFLNVSEAIGIVNARELWSKFHSEEITSLSKEKIEPISKAAAYATISQLARSVEMELVNHPSFFAELSLEFLIDRTDQQIAGAFDSLLPETAATGLLFLTPKRAARVLSVLRRHSPQELVRRMSVQATMSFDDALREAALIEDRLNDSSDAYGFNLASYLSGVLENTNWEQRKEISEAIQDNTHLVRNLRESAITISDVFGFEKDTVAEILSPLSADDLSALFLILENAERGVVENILPPKILMTVKYNVAQIEKKPTSRRKALQLANEVQESILEHVRQMIRDGVIDLYHEIPDEPSSEPSWQDEKVAA